MQYLLWTSLGRPPAPVARPFLVPTLPSRLVAFIWSASFLSETPERFTPRLRIFFPLVSLWRDFVPRKAASFFRARWSCSRMRKKLCKKASRSSITLMALAPKNRPMEPPRSPVKQNASFIKTPLSTAGVMMMMTKVKHNGLPKWFQPAQYFQCLTRVLETRN